MTIKELLEIGKKQCNYADPFNQKECYITVRQKGVAAPELKDKKMVYDFSDDKLHSSRDVYADLGVSLFENEVIQLGNFIIAWNKYKVPGLQIGYKGGYFVIDENMQFRVCDQYGIGGSEIIDYHVEPMYDFGGSDYPLIVLEIKKELV